MNSYTLTNRIIMKKWINEQKCTTTNIQHEKIENIGVIFYCLTVNTRTVCDSFYRGCRNVCTCDTKYNCGTWSKIFESQYSIMAPSGGSGAIWSLVVNSLGDELGTAICQLCGMRLFVFLFCFVLRWSLCHPGWSAIVQSRLTATSTSQAQAILQPQLTSS